MTSNNFTKKSVPWSISNWYIRSKIVHFVSRKTVTSDKSIAVTDIKNNKELKAIINSILINNVKNKFMKDLFHIKIQKRNLNIMIN